MLIFLFPPSVFPTMMSLDSPRSPKFLQRVDGANRGGGPHLPTRFRVIHPRISCREWIVF